MIVFLFFALPVASTVFFIVDLRRFLSAKKENMIRQESVSKYTLKTLKIKAITSFVTAAVFLSVDIAFICLINSAVTFM